MILKIFLNFDEFTPYDSFKKNSYKKQCNEKAKWRVSVNVDPPTFNKKAKWRVNVNVRLPIINHSFIVFRAHSELEFDYFSKNAK